MTPTFCSGTNPRVRTEADIAVDDLAAPADDQERANLVFIGVILWLLIPRQPDAFRVLLGCRLGSSDSPNRKQDAPLLQIKPLEVE
jgi:hypothetical protein